MARPTSEFIELAAQEVLRSAGALSVPVDLDRVAAALGVRVHQEEFEDQVSGVLIVKGAERHIMVNKAHHANRQRFSIAHELGHLLLPGQGHSQRGIMRARLDDWPSRMPAFSDAEAEAIRALAHGQ